MPRLDPTPSTHLDARSSRAWVLGALLLAACGDDDYIRGVYRGNAAQCAPSSDTGRSVQVVVSNIADSDRVAASLVTEVSLPSGQANACVSSAAQLPRSATELEFSGELTCSPEAPRPYQVDLVRDGAGNLTGTLQVATSTCAVLLQPTDASD